MGALDGALDGALPVRLEAERGEVKRQARAVQKAQHCLLAVAGRQRRDAHVNSAPGVGGRASNCGNSFFSRRLLIGEGKATVLRAALLGEIESREHLDARREGVGAGCREREMLAQAAIGEGTIFLAAFGEMKAVLPVALEGAEPLQKAVEWTSQSIVMPEDRVWILARNDEADELIGRLNVAHLPFAVLFGEAREGIEADAAVSLAGDKLAIDDRRWADQAPISRKRVLLRFAELVRAHVLFLEVEQAFGVETGLAPIDKNNVSPRLSVTYDVKGDATQLVRAGVDLEPAEGEALLALRRALGAADDRLPRGQAFC